MLLTELRKGDCALIRHIHADPELRHRLHSFGIIPGEILEVKGCSLARKTMEIDVDGTLIALRKEEAEKIEVEKESCQIPNPEIEIHPNPGSMFVHELGK